MTSHPAAKQQKHNNLAVTDLREKTVEFFDDTARFNSRNNFANLGSFAKVSVPVGSIIPWSNQGIIDPIIPWSNASTISVDMTIAFIHDKYIRYSDKYYCQ